MRRAFFLYWKFPSSCNRWLGVDGKSVLEERLKVACEIGGFLLFGKLGPSINSTGCCITLIEILSPPEMENTPADSKLTSKHINCLVILQRFKRLLQKFSTDTPHFGHFRSIFLQDAPDSGKSEVARCRCPVCELLFEVHPPLPGRRCAIRASSKS